MIRQLEQKDIEKVALIHLLSWQTAFKNILSNNLLDNLTKEEFVMTWEQTIQKTDRQNLVYILGNSPSAFISFGPNEGSKKIAEIYGIYVKPKYWGLGYGKLLMANAIQHLIDSKNYSQVILWVMTKNTSARKFYEKLGFKFVSSKRVSNRKNEFFEESKYTFELK